MLSINRPDELAELNDSVTVSNITSLLSNVFMMLAKSSKDRDNRSNVQGDFLAT
jgi:hypothetical protein